MAMLVSFIAMSTSGVMMFVIEKPSFMIQMNPVHNFFGILMIISALVHIALNFKSIKMHLRFASAIVAVSILTVFLVLLYGAARNNTVPSDLATQMDGAAAEAENNEIMDSEPGWRRGGSAQGVRS